MTNKTDAEILADAPDGATHHLLRSLADITELVELRKKNAELESHNLGLTKTLEQFKLEQQVKGLEWVLDCRELNLSNGEIDTIMDKRNRIIKQAAKLKGVSGNE